MKEIYLQDKTFERENTLAKGEYENCIFNSCDLSNQDLSYCKFIACTFNQCNFGLTKLNDTSFQDTIFRECKMLGLRFDRCNGFGLSFLFENCKLNLASFYRTKIKNTTFRNCQLQEVDFSESDLTGTLFENCNLSQSVFESTVLEKVDFRTSYNYAFDPENNRIKKAKFSISGLPGLLLKYGIEIEN